MVLDRDVAWLYDGMVEASAERERQAAGDPALAGR
jgi:hypothetical protein